MKNYVVTVISHARPSAVPWMAQHLGSLPATWFVSPGERGEYRTMGAEDVIEVEGGVSAARNAALDYAEAHNAICIQISDDLRRLRDARDPNLVRLSLRDAIESMVLHLSDAEAKLAGVAPTANAYFYNPAMPVSRHLFVVGDLIAVWPCGLRFDEKLALKEDYDFTLQHLSRYGSVARLNWILAEFLHGTNRGGAVSYRTTALEQAAIGTLQEKWGDLIVLNPRRENEVLLKWDTGKTRRTRSR